MKNLRGVVYLFVALMLAAVPAAAQTQITTGVIQGTVLDASGGAVPAAAVEAKNLDTNYSRTADTGDDGRFVFLQLPPGRYTVTVTKAGFARLVQENLNLTVGQAINLTLNMKVAAATETVTVTDTPTVDTVKTEASTTLNTRTVELTPVLGRKFEDLLTLTPGVSVVQGPDGDEITFNGQRGIFTNVSLDGGDYINGFFGEQVGGQRAAIDIPLDAVREFQVVASGANAEFGRTAAGVINVISRSGTNEVHGSLYHFQRHENLTASASDGSSLTDFHREQFGGSIGGPIVKDKAFYFATIERITGNLQRPNLSEQLGPSACSVATPLVGVDDAVIASSDECARVALLNFFRTSVGQEEGLPVRRPIYTTAPFLKLDWNVTPNHQFAFSYNFNTSKKINETFDVRTYGNSANGIEGNFTKINVLNFNLFSSFSTNLANEGHFTYSREVRPRSAVSSNVPADTAMGFGTAFRFGAPFFLNRDIDETFWRTQIRDNLTWVAGRHTVKFGGEWIHSLNDQVFRGFFLGRYIFSDVVGFMHYASPAAMGAGFGPNAQGCSDGSYVTAPTACPAGTTNNGTPLLLYLQGAGPNFAPATDAAGASKIDNEEYAMFVQDKWQVNSRFTLSYGLRWESQIFPDSLVDPATTAYGTFLSNPLFPSNGTLPSEKRMWQPRLGMAWDLWGNQKSVLRANAGIFNGRQNMLTQVGSITTNGVFQSTIAGGLFANPTVLPTWPGVVSVPAPPPCLAPPAPAFPCFTGVRVFHRDYRNPRVYSWNIAYEHDLGGNVALYTDFSYARGVYLTRFLNFNRGEFGSPFSLQLGEVMTATSFGQSLYRGWTLGMRKRFSHRVQFDMNYTLAYDYDDDSNERDPFTDRFFNPTIPRIDYALSDRDIRHKYNFYMYAQLPWGFEFAPRIQAHSAQPITPSPRILGGVDRGRNTLRKNNEYFSWDWRLTRPFKIGERWRFIPTFEMFNTFDNDNNINPLTTPGLFNFDGFLRQGVGDPRQVQLAIKIEF